jgi:hypothetical protein
MVNGVKRLRKIGEGGKETFIFEFCINGIQVQFADSVCSAPVAAEAVLGLVENSMGVEEGKESGCKSLFKDFAENRQESDRTIVVHALPILLFENGQHF